MTRQITIAYKEQHQMYDVSFERQGNATIYHVTPNVNSKASIPRQFDIVKADDSEQPQFDIKDLNDEDKLIVNALWEQISSLPPQFSGGKDKSTV